MDDWHDGGGLIKPVLIKFLSSGSFSFRSGKTLRSILMIQTALISSIRA